MEGGAVPEEPGYSYEYWVKETTVDAAPLPVPKMLSPQDFSNLSSLCTSSIGSVWNRAGTWEEKNLNKWATDRIKELLVSVGSLDFSNGNAEITEVSRCAGDASLVTVRDNKRFGYTYELTINVKGECHVRGEKRKAPGNLEVSEFSYGELDDLEMIVKLNEDKDLPQQDRLCITQDLKRYLHSVREKLVQFE